MICKKSQRNSVLKFNQSLDTQCLYVKSAQRKINITIAVTKSKVYYCKLAKSKIDNMIALKVIDMEKTKPASSLVLNFREYCTLHTSVDNHGLNDMEIQIPCNIADLSKKQSAWRSKDFFYSSFKQRYQQILKIKKLLNDFKLFTKRRVAVQQFKGTI